MPAKTIASIRQYLYILVAVVVLALMGSLAYTIYSNTQYSIAQEKIRLRTLSTIIASNTTYVLERNQEALERIAKRPGIQAMSPSQCDPILVEFRQLFPQFANLATVDLQGTAPCSGVRQPGGKPVSVAKTEWFKRGLAQKHFLAGNPFIGPITGRLVSVLVQPVWGEQNDLLGFVGLPLDLANFDPHISSAQLPRGTRFGILAEDGTLIWRNVDSEHLIGKNIGAQPAPRQTLLVRDGEFKSTGTDGVERYYSVTPIPMVHWYAFVGVESSQVYGNVLRSALGNSMFALLNLLIIGALVLFLVRRISQADDELVRARDAAEQANRAKSTFLANMSHELRTPLNAILGFSNMLRQDAEITASQRDDLNIINRSGEHLLSLINDVLEMSKIEAGQMKLQNSSFDPGLLVREVVDMMQGRAREKGLRLLIEQSTGDSLFIVGDEAKLRQVLINLLGNALKFTQDGGITVRLGVTPESNPQFLLLEVEDSGIGITPEEQQYIFEPFVQLRQSGMQKGTGLGLAITRQFIQLMGGSIGVQSAPNKGSLFRVELPLHLAEKTAESAKPQAAGVVLGLAPGQPEYRILIVEDQMENRVLLERLLQRAGFKVMSAENGEVAIEMFNSWHPDFIWMDRRMPVMDGVEATRRIRALPGGADVKIAAISASVFQEQREELVSIGMDDFVRKPYRDNEVYECMAKHLGVRYVYSNPPATGERVETTKLTPAMLQALPLQLRQSLQEAALSLDSDRIAAAIEEIAAIDSALAKILTQLAANFDYPAMLRALQVDRSGNEYGA